MTHCKHGRRRSSPGPGPTLLLGALVLASAAFASPVSAARRQARTTATQGTPAPTRTVYLRVVPCRHVVTTYHYHRVLVRRSDGRVLSVGPAFQLARSQGPSPTAPVGQAAAKSPAAQLTATKTPATPPAAAKPTAAKPTATKPAATQLAAAKPSGPAATTTKPVTPGAVVKPSPVAPTQSSARRRRHASRRPRWIRALIGGRH
jgi:hypothetical protein